MLQNFRTSPVTRWTTRLLILTQIAIVCLHAVHVHPHHEEGVCVHQCEHSGETHDVSVTPYRSYDAARDEVCGICHLLHIQVQPINAGEIAQNYPPTEFAQRDYLSPDVLDIHTSLSTRAPPVVA